MEIKLCKDCKFYGISKNSETLGFYACLKSLGCPISGDFVSKDTNVYTARRDYCGISAIYFESRNYEKL